MAHESGKDRLPNGWIVRTSSKFPDRIYYFNTLTGNSTWECPELVPRRASNEKEEPAYKPTPKRSLDGQINIVGGHFARSSPNIVGGHLARNSHTPEEIPSLKKPPHVNVDKNVSKKRSLEIDIPTTSRMGHSPKKMFPFHKPPTVNTHNQNKSKEQQLETCAPYTSKTDISKGLKIPTAIVTPVIAGEENTSSHASNSVPQTLNRKKRNRRKKKGKQKGNSVPPTVVSTALPSITSTVLTALPSTIKEEKHPSILVPQPKNEFKRLRTSPPIREKLVTDQNKPPISASTSYENNESLYTDSDMDLEFGSSLNAIPSTSKEITAFERNDDCSWTEVEMLDVSADLTNLDEIVPARDPNQLNSHYIVVDTNVLIHDRIHIEEIKETPLQGCGPPHFIIPWVVFQELDRLKSYNDALGKLAQKAVRYVHTILKSKHPRFHGQSGEDAHKLKREYHDSNDDKIIDLCLSLRKKMAPEKVILMTNDKNLANKSMIYEIIVHDWASLLKDIMPDMPIQASSSKKKKSKKRGSDESVPAIMTKEKLKLVNERSGYEQDIDFLMAEARQMLKNALDPFLVEEMQNAYGAAWEHFNIDRRLLREILAAYIRFWPTVFYLHFNNKLKNSFELLHQKAIGPEGFNGTLEECLMILHAIEDIFRAIVKVRPDMSSLIANIQSLQENYTHIFSKYSNVDSSISDVENAIKTSERTLVLEILNRNWTVINELCGMIMDFYGVQHTFEYAKPVALPPESEYRRVVADLYPSLLQLKQIMKKVVEHVINSTPSQPTFKKFVRGLKELIPSLRIEFVMPDMTHFTPKAVEQFCRNPENRQKIEYGYKQLENFCNKLSEAIQAMISFKKNCSSTS